VRNLNPYFDARRKKDQLAQVLFLKEWEWKSLECMVLYRKIMCPLPLGGAIHTLLMGESAKRMDLGLRITIIERI
jgi:hypothetical protein